MAITRIGSNNVAVNTGTVMSWSNSTIPSGFLECDGSAVSRTTYSALFAVISTDYGSGDGSSTFNLPDLQDKTMVGASSGKAYSTTGGAESVTVSNHTLTTSELASHNHATTMGGTNSISGIMENRAPTGGGTHRGTINLSNASQGSNSAHNHGSLSVLQPYMALKFMIKT